MYLSTVEQDYLLDFHVCFCVCFFARFSCLLLCLFFCKMFMFPILGELKIYIYKTYKLFGSPKKFLIYLFNFANIYIYI